MIERAEVVEQEAAKVELRRILKEDPTFAYAELLAARSGVWRAQADTLTPFAVAFEAALSAGDKAAFDALDQRHDAQKELVVVGRAVLGDEQAALQVEDMLRAAPKSTDARSVVVLRRTLSMVLISEETSHSMADALAKQRDAVIVALRDVNESGLGDALSAA